MLILYICVVPVRRTIVAHIFNYTCVYVCTWLCIYFTDIAFTSPILVCTDMVVHYIYIYAFTDISVHRYFYLLRDKAASSISTGKGLLLVSGRQVAVSPDIMSNVPQVIGAIISTLIVGSVINCGCKRKTNQKLTVFYCVFFCWLIVELILCLVSTVALA